jgi:hypothetical protein
MPGIPRRMGREESFDMADQLTPRGSALLSGTRRRLVKAGAAVAWTVPVMQTLSAEMAFAGISPGQSSADVICTNRQSACDTNTTSVSRFCYDCKDGKVQPFTPGGFMVRATICIGSQQCNLTATLSVYRSGNLLSDFGPFGLIGAASAVQYCVGSGPAVNTTAGAEVKISNINGPTCVRIDWHLILDDNVLCEGFGGDYVFQVTAECNNEGIVTLKDTVAAVLKTEQGCTTGCP